MNDPAHLRLIEALIFASREPVSERAMAERLPEATDIPQLLAELEAHYAVRGFNLVQRGQGWAFRTAPDLAEALKVERTQERKLSRAATETLAIIAYHQPVTRAEIEEIRGVALSKGTLDTLFAAGWVAPKGRRRTPGRPLTWATTDGFLDHFGLTSVDDLPGVKELEAAGLLDARAAAGAYGNRAVDGDRLVDTGPEEEDAQLDLLDEEDILGIGE
ncbi:SMC-Scp complex subunit ScpB [Paramagnetospirillum marisnigri]|uniref:SMC-Scp complex subunit ScpB n=1 Tax=Paramagnetospirillum marisnigri TaxID=1285242 RepID=A0A178M7L7_9PROT|nr:SMC-Scp complex subunit ScpB [Paramagnetospirillum marisnigri]OAN44048.1 SMC-Scp complex subunit ScpB [Paramagnetospirillum marisnigri]